MRLAIIPARSGSTRIPDKNVIDFCGKPMFAHPLAAARESGLFDTIHVSTDSQRYAAIARDLGFAVDFLRDPSLSENDVGTIEVLRWVVGEYRRRGRRFDDVYLITATAALIEAGDLNRAHALFERHGRRYPVATAAPYPSPIEFGFRIREDGMLQALFPEKQALHSQDLVPAYHETGAFFIIAAERLMADTAPVYNEFLPCVLPPHKAVDIDAPEDLEMAKMLFLGRAALRESSAGK